MEEAQHLGEVLNNATNVSIILCAERYACDVLGRGKRMPASEGGPMGGWCAVWVPENAKDRFSDG